jgi:hypothetical protein
MGPRSSADEVEVVDDDDEEEEKEEVVGEGAPFDSRGEAGRRSLSMNSREAFNSISARSLTLKISRVQASLLSREVRGRLANTLPSRSVVRNVPLCCERMKMSLIASPFRTTCRPPTTAALRAG